MHVRCLALLRYGAAPLMLLACLNWLLLILTHEGVIRASAVSPLGVSFLIIATSVGFGTTGRCVIHSWCVLLLTLLLSWKSKQWIWNRENKNEYSSYSYRNDVVTKIKRIEEQHKVAKLYLPPPQTSLSSTLTTSPSCLTPYLPSAIKPLSCPNWFYWA